MKKLKLKNTYGYSRSGSALSNTIDLSDEHTTLENINNDDFMVNQANAHTDTIVLTSMFDIFNEETTLPVLKSFIKRAHKLADNGL